MALVADCGFRRNLGTGKSLSFVMFFWGRMMQTSSWIALLAVFVACLSAIYARRAVTEARHANAIALHNERLKIYKAFLDIRAKVTAQGVDLKERDLFCEFYEYVELSEFYFDKEFSGLLNEYFSCLWNITKSRDLWEASAEGGEEKKKERQKETFALLKKAKDIVPNVEEEFKKRLRITKT